MEEFLTVGLWGGEGGDRWSFVVNNGGIIGMEIVHASGIASITFKCGDEYGVLQRSRKFGTTSGGSGWKTDKISLNWPEEYLISISGTVADLFQHTIIRSVSFKTNKGTEYGPYGAVTGQPFSYRTEGGVIVGFHGRSGTLIDAIGAYVKIPQKKQDNTLKMVLPVPRDGSCLSFKPIEKDYLTKSNPLVKVFLDWSDKEHEIYDSNYLKDLPEVHKFSAKKTRQEAISLFSCLEAFLTEEPLGPDDMWYCPRCKEHRQATKKLDLWTLPDILVVHLKRFSYSRYLKNKLDTFVNFPIRNLNLSKYVKSKDGQSQVYDLYAISNHYGGLGGGHYTAYAKLIDENRWYDFDDSRVSPVGESDIKTSAAYLLFYQRVKGEPRAGAGETSEVRMG